jgi:predicted nucleotidyltransferase
MAGRQSASSFASIFASATFTSLLGVFLIRPEQRFYQRELERLTGCRLSLVQRELSRLERSGLVRKTRSGNRVYYVAATDHPAFPGLQDAFKKTIGVADVIRVALAPWADQIVAAFIYGSVARGDELAHSDIDVFVITSLDPAVLTTGLAELSDALGREVNVSVYPVDEVRRGVAGGRPFLEEVLQGSKLWLMGDEDVVEALVSGSLVEGADA